MTKSQFMVEFASIIGLEATELSPEQRLKDFSGWDSMCQMSLLTLLDTDLGIVVPPNWISTCDTVGQVLNLAEPHLE